MVKLLLAARRVYSWNIKELNKQFWGQHLWARGYFAASSGNVTDEVIIEYMKNQDIEENQKIDNFTVDEF